MAPQVTNRREGDLTSCRGRSWKFPAFTLKELETVSAVNKLLGAPTGRWECLDGGGGGS
jgi:hypothetical protein